MADRDNAATRTGDRLRRQPPGACQGRTSGGPPAPVAQLSRFSVGLAGAAATTQVSGSINLRDNFAPAN